MIRGMFFFVGDCVAGDDWCTCRVGDSWNRKRRSGFSCPWVVPNYVPPGFSVVVLSMLVTGICLQDVEEVAGIRGFGPPRMQERAIRISIAYQGSSSPISTRRYDATCSGSSQTCSGSSKFSVVLEGTDSRSVQHFHLLRNEAQSQNTSVFWLRRRMCDSLFEVDARRRAERTESRAAIQSINYRRWRSNHLSWTLSLTTGTGAP